MDLLTCDYLRSRGDKLLLGALLGLALAILVGLWPRRTDILLYVLVFGPVFSCPYTFRSAIGRLWWTLHLSTVFSLVDVRLSGLMHPWGWFGVLHCMGFAAAGFVVRWDPPTEKIRVTH